MTTLTENDISTIDCEIHGCCDAAEVPTGAGAMMANDQLHQIVVTVSLHLIGSIMRQIREYVN
jgi:hypothetical protein